MRKIWIIAALGLAAGACTTTEQRVGGAAAGAVAGTAVAGPVGTVVGGVGGAIAGPAVAQEAGVPQRRRARRR